jgi:hypothetical protein
LLLRRGLPMGIPSLVIANSPRSLRALKGEFSREEN